jgi:hypothetical protein
LDAANTLPVAKNFLFFVLNKDICLMRIVMFCSVSAGRNAISKLEISELLALTKYVEPSAHHLRTIGVRSCIVFGARFCAFSSFRRRNVPDLREPDLPEADLHEAGGAFTRPNP